MEVKIIPMPGCLLLILGVCTLGVATLAIKAKEKHWPKVVDDDGLITTGGKRYGWADFTKVVKVVTDVDGTVTERYDLQSAKGTVGLFLGRIENAEEVFNYIWERLPDTAKS